MSQVIVLYTTPLCPPCDALKRLLVSEGLAFEIKDLLIDEQAAALVESKGIRTAPALGIDGEIYAGEELRPDRLVELLYP